MRLMAAYGCAQNKPSVTSDGWYVLYRPWHISSHIVMIISSYVVATARLYPFRCLLWFEYTDLQFIIGVYNLCIVSTYPHFYLQIVPARPIICNISMPHILISAGRAHRIVQVRTTILPLHISWRSSPANRNQIMPSDIAPFHDIIIILRGSLSGAVSGAICGHIDSKHTQHSGRARRALQVHTAGLWLDTDRFQ